MAEHVVLSAERHFETLREAVWLRFCARHRASDRERFEDAYSEWWAREAERAANGAPSRATAPAAFIAEAVHRVLIDDARARARGLARDAKGSLELVDIDGQLDASASDDTAETATYEALVHRVLTLIRGRLTERETRIFVWSFLYLQPSEVTAEALGLTLPRVKKDRRKIAAKVGEEVWQVLAGELDLCAAYDEKSLPAIFEILTIHVEDCPVCSAALGGMRRGALAVIGPELVLVEASTHAVSDVVDSVVARLHSLFHRSVEVATAIPPNGRTAAAVAVAATALAGGAATVVPEVSKKHESKPRHAERKPHTVARVTRTPALVTPVAPISTPRPAATAAHHQVRRVRRPAAARTAAPTAAPAAPQDPVTFEQQAAAPAPTTANVSSSSSTSSQSSPQAAAKEFGFESP